MTGGYTPCKVPKTIDTTITKVENDKDVALISTFSSIAHSHAQACVLWPSTLHSRPPTPHSRPLLPSHEKQEYAWAWRCPGRQVCTSYCRADIVNKNCPTEPCPCQTSPLHLSDISCMPSPSQHIAGMPLPPRPPESPRSAQCVSKLAWYRAPNYPISSLSSSTIHSLRLACATPNMRRLCLHDLTAQQARQAQQAQAHDQLQLHHHPLPHYLRLRRHRREETRKYRDEGVLLVYIESVQHFKDH